MGGGALVAQHNHRRAAFRLPGVPAAGNTNGGSTRDAAELGRNEWTAVGWMTWPVVWYKTSASLGQPSRHRLPWCVVGGVPPALARSPPVNTRLGVCGPLCCDHALLWSCPALLWPYPALAHLWRTQGKSAVCSTASTSGIWAWSGDNRGGRHKAHVRVWGQARQGARGRGVCKWPSPWRWHALAAAATADSLPKQQQQGPHLPREHAQRVHQSEDGVGDAPL